MKEQERNNKKPHEMSVEEILRSVRNIMENSSPNTEEDILELTDIAAEEENNELISSNRAHQTTGILKDFAMKANHLSKDYKKTSAKGIEEFVIEMLRPQIKSWLDRHLPSLVKELVEKELKKLVPDE